MEEKEEVGLLHEIVREKASRVGAQVVKKGYRYSVSFAGQRVNVLSLSEVYRLLLMLEFASGTQTQNP